MAEEIGSASMDSCEHFKLACEFDTGSNGRPKDPVQAAIHLTRAAEAGHGLATHNLAARYLYGQGVPQDFEMARSWVLRSKARGSTIADDTLAFIDKKQQEFAANGILPTLAKPPNTTNEEPSLSFNFLTPALFLVGLAFLIYIASQINSSNPGFGKYFIGLTFGLAALGLFLNIIWGGTVNETAKNLLEMIKNVALTALGIGLLASIGYCSGGHSPSNEGVGGVPDQVRSR